MFSFQDGLSLVIQRAKVLSEAASDQAGVADFLGCCSEFGAEGGDCDPFEKGEQQLLVSLLAHNILSSFAKTRSRVACICTPADPALIAQV